MPQDTYGNRWKIIRSLDEGGQAHVFLVEDIQSGNGEQFVLKRLKNVNRLDRFSREIEAIKKLNHPNILPLIDADLSPERPYFVSPFADGGSLAKYAEHYKNNPEKALDLVACIADGLAHAHDNRIVHRDIKPANIFLAGEDRHPVIGDFGICHVENGDRLTLIDEAVGSRLFVAPELEDGRADEVKASSDVYSLGKILYWLLAGGRVFAREQHRSDSWNLVARLSHSRFEHVNRLLDYMITPKLSERYRNGEAAAASIRHVSDLVRKEARAIAPGLPQVCDFCKQGNYKEINLGNNIAVHNFGLAPVGHAQWHALVCEVCGHLQLFRLENAKEKKPFWGR